MLPGTTSDRSPRSAQNTRSTRPASIRNLAVIALVVPGIFATVALPAYAYSPDAADGSQQASALEQLREEGAQTLAVTNAKVAGSRDGYGSVSAAERRAAAQRSAVASYAGPTVRDFLANPPYPHFSLDKVVKVALTYRGSPYVFGGSTPAGFDCSGFVMYVYAQFGVSLPHSSSAQGSGGVLISRADARPGDVVVMDGGGHSGIYMGGNTMVHSPKPGGHVEVHPIWDPNAWFVRYGI